MERNQGAFARRRTQAQSAGRRLWRGSERFWRSIRRWVIDNVRWIDALKVAGVWIAATYIGDTAFEVVTQRWWQRDGWELVFRGAVLVAAILLATGLVPSVLEMIQGRGQSAVDHGQNIKSAPGLIVYVSAAPPKRGLSPEEQTAADEEAFPNLVAKKAIDRFLDPEVTILRHVFLIHSDQSRRFAERLKKYIDATPSVEAHIEDLEADFNDLKAMKDVTSSAIDEALRFVKPKELVVDITGGTGIASAGGVLAVLNRKDIVVSFIPRKGNDLGNEITTIDVRWARAAYGERSLSPGREVEVQR